VEKTKDVDQNGTIFEIILEGNRRKIRCFSDSLIEIDTYVRQLCLDGFRGKGLLVCLYQREDSPRCIPQYELPLQIGTC